MKDPNEKVKNAYHDDKEAFLQTNLKTFENVLSRSKSILEKEDYEAFKTGMIRLINDN